MVIRTRIAPSPTGELHIGHVRTALYDYALAKKHGGQFIVRIEDTDRNRFVEGSMERTLQVLKDYGLVWDEGPEAGGPYEPYIQTQRLDLYKRYANELVEKKGAYYCFCTQERLEEVRKKQQEMKLPRTSYDRHCRNLSSEEVAEKLKNSEPYVIRLKSPENENIILNDIIHGNVTFNSNDMDDSILLKSDGIPTYHLASVVDDHIMKISHVIRGIDWMPSSPIHLYIYKILGWDVPLFAHLPNLKEKGMNAKLSKRHGSVAAVDFLTEGYLPEAVINFLMFLGWNPGTEKELYTFEEFINDFSLEKVQKTDLVAFDRDKLVWFNGAYIRKMAVDQLLSRLRAWSEKYGVNLVLSGDNEFDLKVTALLQERLKTLSEFNDLASYFYTQPQVDESTLLSFAGSKDRAQEILKSFSEVFSQISNENWTRDNLDNLCHDVIGKHEYKPKEAFMTLRVALTGQTATPQIFDILEVLGKQESLDRVNRFYSN